MGILYNATLTPAMNDISVTSGNADGWVYAVAINVDPVALRTVAVKAVEASRRAADAGKSASAGEPSRSRKR
jgi:hypothetical protein